ncbi:hypothetical protein PIB30_096379 [Stylosanthes scabra]|uniref:Uncharacterized protein n=1 Tax=Stylosanthes scabra TaxID=79078 RepID=A0ABU6XX13_9FABA|nr:hypothetical protein [Stylosanthes scabra]
MLLVVAVKEGMKKKMVVPPLQLRVAAGLPPWVFGTTAVVTKIHHRRTGVLWSHRSRLKRQQNLIPILQL